MLSFQKAAANLVDFIEFDVHVTADGEVVCFHDFEVKLGIGSEVVRLGIPALSYSQLRRCGMPQIVSPSWPYAQPLQVAHMAEGTLWIVYRCAPSCVMGMLSFMCTDLSPSCAPAQEVSCSQLMT